MTGIASRCWAPMGCGAQRFGGSSANLTAIHLLPYVCSGSAIPTCPFAPPRRGADHGGCSGKNGSTSTTPLVAALEPMIQWSLTGRTGAP